MSALLPAAEYYRRLAEWLSRKPPMRLVRLCEPGADLSAIVSACESAGFRAACYHAGGQVVVIRGGTIAPEAWVRAEARQQVKTIIARHLGRTRAISISQIANVTALSAREIKAHVHDLRMLGVRIGSCRVADGEAVAGYFMVETRQELVDSLRPYQRQVLTELALIQQMLGKRYRAAGEIEDQLALDLGAPYAP